MTARVAVLGTGANGAGIGADLVRAGHDVTFIEQWPAHVDAMRARGIHVEMPDESHTTPVTVHHLCEVAEMREPFDIVFIVVKAYDTRWASELIAPLLAPDGLAIGLQNGMMAEEMAGILGAHRTLGAVIEITANMFEPGIVDRQSSRAHSWFALGALDDSTRGREEEAASILRAAGTVEISDDIRSSKWMKLVANAAELVPSAILDLPLGEAVRMPGMREFMEKTAHEAVRACLASGGRLMPIFGMTERDIAEPDDYAVILLDKVLRDYTMPTTLTTVLQDWRKGRRGEVEELNGFVVREQERLGGSAPCNARVERLARQIESGARRAGADNLELLLAGS
ncbi:MAG: 2-dehydropantoate 2-reductase [Microcella sp.]|uniref:ketopantoate reductase family protein n=1 Tax=Microcella sp. TaxID=1913979 RepID=UPI003315E6A8